MTYDYRAADKAAALIDAYVLSTFRKIKSLLPVDEINALQTRQLIKRVDALTKGMSIYARRVLKQTADRYYLDALELKRISDLKLDEAWIEDLLTQPDPVTKYSYFSEEDRKRARLTEALVVSDTPAKDADAAAKRFSLQYRVYTLIAADAAVRTAMKENGDVYVQWVAEEDAKTCAVCAGMDGRVYKLADLPAKPHINCRCTLRSVKNGKPLRYQTPAGRS